MLLWLSLCMCFVGSARLHEGIGWGIVIAANSGLFVICLRHEIGSMLARSRGEMASVVRSMLKQETEEVKSLVELMHPDDEDGQ